MDEVLLTVAANTGGLRSCFLYGRRPSSHTLKELVHANLFLQEVALDSFPLDENFQEFEECAGYMSRILAMFATCGELRSISVPNPFHGPVTQSVAVKDASARFRFRNVSIHFFDVEYGQNLCRSVLEESDLRQ